MDKTKLSKRIFSLLACVALLGSMIPLFTLGSVAAAEQPTVLSDPSTMEQWKQFFPLTGDLHTRNAGGVWNDKSVFTANTTIEGQEFALSGDNRFLVALSSIGSTMSIAGRSAVPTDTVLVLDMSSSMSGSVGALATAADVALKSLHKANPDNRVSVVIYSANSTSGTKVFLPLDTYAATGDYLISQGDTILVAGGVTDSSGDPVNGSVSLNRGTYIQGGIAKAKEVLDARTEVENRIPVMVLMTDGEPTIGSTNFITPNGNMGFGVNGVYGGDDYAFAVQLSLAYMKQVVYPDLKLYTIGVGVDDSNQVMDIMDPTDTLRTSNLRTYWNTYKAAAVGSNVKIGSRTFQKPAELNYDYVTKIDQDGQKVNAYFSASGSNLTEKLSEAFQSVVDDIVKSTVFSPTLIQGGGHELSGYVSFVDRIGQYMQVSDVKGLVYDGHLFTGEEMAQAMQKTYQGDPDGVFGTVDALTPMGQAFIESIETRLGVDITKANAVLNNACEKGQIAYNAATGAYSNWFGWVSTAAGTYIEPWYEGMTLSPDAGYINRNYVYLGDGKDADMLYSTVSLREKVENGAPNGEQEVVFAIPAALLPTITYEVTLDEKNDLENINVIPDTPVHLVYEVGMNPAINPFNLRDKVSADYLEKNTDPTTGEVYFYTNEWERTPDDNGQVTGYGKSNTYAYFRPARQNDRYYQNDSAVYTDTKGTVYSGQIHPATSGETRYYYSSYYAYDASTNRYSTVGEYCPIPQKVLMVAAEKGDGTWYIKKGTIRSDYAGSEADTIYKDDPTTDAPADGNKTGTLRFSHEPFADSNSHAWDDTTHNAVGGVTLANNGRLSMTPATGIRLSKQVVDAPAEGAFTFRVEGEGLTGERPAFAYRLVKGEPVGREETVTFDDGTATVTLNSGESLYIGGLTPGEVRVTEQTTLEYTLQTVSVDGETQSGSVAKATLSAGKMTHIDFVNTRRGTGSFTVSKKVNHPFGEEYVIPQNEYTAFRVELAFTFDDKPLAGTYPVTRPDGTADTLTLLGEADETTAVTLRDGDRLGVHGLPEGAKVTAREVLTDKQQGAFASSFREDIDQVTVKADDVVSVGLINTYTPKPVSPALSVSGQKRLAGDTYAGRFDFQLQRYKGSGAYITESSWETLEEKTLTYENALGDRAFAFTYDWSQQLFTTVGTTLYRVHESHPITPGVTYDIRMHIFEVTVTDDDMDGALEIADVTTGYAPLVTVAPSATGKGWQVDTLFENTYTNDNTTTATVALQKVVQNPTGSPLGTSLSGYTFGLYDSEGALMSSSVTSDMGEVGFRIPYTAADIGSHRYTLREIVPEEVPTGWTYTDKVVTVTVTVSQVPGQNLLQAMITTDDTTAEYTEAGDVYLTFENLYDPADATLSVDFVEKKLITTAGDRPLQEGEFAFAIYPVSSDGVRGDSPVATGRNTAEGKVTFTPGFTYSKVGSSLYDIVERKPDNAPDYITYDPTVYRMRVTVTDEGGRLKATPTLLSAAENRAVFTNTYTPRPVSLSIEGKKTLSGRVMTENDFQFRLTNADTGSLLYTTNTLSGSHESGFYFPAITYTAVGQYRYTVSEYDPTKEVAGYRDGVTYDDRVYEVTVTVTDDQQGRLVASCTVNGGEGEILFENHYQPAPVETSIVGTKLLFGRPITNEDGFAFELFAADFDPYTITWDKQEKIAQTTSSVAGEICFELPAFTAAGLYGYVVQEVTGSVGGVDYDHTLWQVVVDVRDDREGHLSSTVYYYKDARLQDKMVFTNTYTPAAADITLKGEKELTGRKLQDREFGFTLYKATDDTFATLDGVVKTARNDGEGGFGFTLGYTQEDVGHTFYYVAREDNAGLTLKGVTHSEATYHIAVTVEDNLDGTLQIIPVITLNGEAVDVLRFENEYHAHAAAVIDITKVVENKSTATATPEGFVFELTGEEGQTRVTSNANGRAVITLEFDETDSSKTYTYTLCEIAGDTPHMTYDERIYTITLSVATVGDVLVVTPTVNGDVVERVAVDFVNVYDYTLPTTTTTIQTTEVTESQPSVTVIPSRTGMTDTDPTGTPTSSSEGSTAVTSTPSTESETTVSSTTGSSGEPSVSSTSVTETSGSAPTLSTTLVSDPQATETEMTETNPTDSFPRPLPTQAPDVTTPSTGETANIGWWLALLFVSLGGLIATTIWGKKQQE